MAFTPCALHRAMYTGGSNTFFLRLANGQQSYGGKKSVCADCASILLETLGEKMIKVSEGETFISEPESEVCANCHAKRGTDSWAFFGNAYPRGKAPTQWYGQICTKCLPAVMEDFGIAP